VVDNETDLVVTVEVGQIWVSSSLVAGAHVEILSATNRPACWLVAVMSGQRPAACWSGDGAYADDPQQLRTARLLTASSAGGYDLADLPCRQPFGHSAAPIPARTLRAVASVFADVRTRPWRRRTLRTVSSRHPFDGARMTSTWQWSGCRAGPNSVVTSAMHDNRSPLKARLS